MLTILAIHLTNPNIICGFIIKNMNLLSTNKGKITVYFIISIMYWSTRTTPQLFFAIISFITTSGMLLFEILKGSKKSNIEQKDVKIEVKNNEVSKPSNDKEIVDKNKGIINSYDNTANKLRLDNKVSLADNNDNNSSNINNSNNTNNTSNNNDTNNTNNNIQIGLINE